jgi:acetolactate synthase-1/2/3 large subunit
MRDPSETRGAEAVVRALEAEGVPCAFGIPGTHNIELWDRLAGSDRVAAIAVTDEQSASFMADGLWRASGRLGCVNLVPGAGLTHALSGIAEAFLDGVPMLVLGCGIRRDTGHAFQLHDVDQLALARPVTKGVFRPLRGEDLYDAVRGACALARAAPPGPVMVEVPANLYMLPGSGPLAKGGARDPEREHAPAPAAPAVPVPPSAPDPASVRRAAELLAGAKRPLLYVGLGAAGAGAGLLRLAERLEAPVATTLSGKGVVPETHPLAMWPGLGAAAPPFVREVTAGCDATLAIGCRFAEVGTGSYGWVPPSPLVHADADPGALDRNVRAELAIVADAAEFVRALDAALDELGVRRRPDADLRTRIRLGLDAVRSELRTPTGAEGVTPGLLFEGLQRRLPEARFATDSGNGTFLAAEGLRLAGPGRFLAPVDYSCMGYSVPAAIGAALDGTGRPAVALVGDGAFLMTGLEMLTAAVRSLPVAFLVLRDRELAQIAQFQATAYNRRPGSRLPDYDLASICAGVGLECIRIRGDGELDEALDAVATAVGEGRPVAADVAIDYSRKTWFTRGVVRTNFRRLPWTARVRFVARALGRRLSADGDEVLFFDRSRSHHPRTPERRDPE